MIYTQKMFCLIIGVVVLLCLLRLFPNVVEERFFNTCIKIKQLLNISKLKQVSIITVVVMLVTHLYSWVNGVFLNDTARIFREIPKKIMVGTDTWLRPFIDPLFDGGGNLPWFSGVWAIVFMIISVYCITEILEIHKKWAIILVAGLCASNSSIICQQAFTGGGHVGIVALAFACVALWVIENKNISFKKKLISSPILIAFSAATYGAYVSLIPSLMLLLVLIDVFKGNFAKENWKKAFTYLLYFLLGMFLYYFIFRILLFTTGGQMSSYKGEDQLANISVILNMLHYIPSAYLNIFLYYGAHTNYLPEGLQWLLSGIMLLGLFLTLSWMYCNKDKIKDEKSNGLLLLLIIVLLPLAINLIDIISMGETHYLMIFSYVVPLLFFVRLLQECLGYRHSVKNLLNIKLSRISVLVGVLLGVFLYFSILMANALYTNYYHKYENALTIATRIINRIESCEGFNGTEQIVLIGDMKFQKDSYFHSKRKNEPAIIDAWLGTACDSYSSGINYGHLLVPFLDNVMDSSLTYSYYYSILDYKNSVNKSETLTDEIEKMKDFPNEESVKKIDNTIYVVFSHNKN